VAIEALDVLYRPSRDVAADVAFYRDVLGARVVGRPAPRAWTS
jgi:hypothetical protein